MTEARSDDPHPQKTTLLLDEWHRGDGSALGTLLDEHLAFLRDFVRRNAAPALLSKFDVDDFVQDTASQILTYAPRFQVRDGRHFRGLLARMVLTSMSEKWRYLTAMRRDMNRESRVPSDSVLHLDPSADPVQRPSELATQQEEEEWVRLGLELLRDSDRVVILKRNWEERSFVAIGEELGMDPSAVRMRFNRAMDRLATIIRALQTGTIPDEEHDER